MYEQKLLVQSLVGMGDVVWCPRCRHAVVSDKSNKLGACPVCHFSFCINCRLSWHPGSPCLTLAEKVQQLEEKAEVASTKSELQFVEQLRAAVEAELKFAEWVEKHAKKCPCCQATIEKISGCNRTTFSFLFSLQTTDGQQKKKKKKKKKKKT
eukprot:TRINITY_DN3373_c0_g1_i2.p1 TRINITY_DN3373_c0_g1~~TRINITY_DN3373_c0_g1_i2.p1  ORF type:complete len:153 (-),score=45.60 TRINITY_DN3373_c0_g1_i2:176-634(-)